MRIQMYGQPYNSTTLEGCQPDPKALFEKVIFFFLLITRCFPYIVVTKKKNYLSFFRTFFCAIRAAGEFLSAIKPRTKNI